MQAKKIIHILPTDGIGGAEIAALSSIGIRNECYSLFVKYLFKTSIDSPFRRFFYVLESLNTTLDIIKFQPDLIIVSLWKSCLSAIIIRCFRPKIKIILFLHLPKSVNFLDYFFTFITSRIASQIWGDSTTTIENRTKELNVDKNVRKKFQKKAKYKQY